jgi:hypothetical protein
VETEAQKLEQESQENGGAQKKAGILAIIRIWGSVKINALIADSNKRRSTFILPPAR